MPDTDHSLTLEGLAQILRDHMDGTAAQFAEVRASIQDLRGEIGTVATLVRDLSQIVLRQMDEVAQHRRELREHRQQSRQIFSRMEQHDAMIAQTTQEIRRILDAMERRGGNGGSRPDAGP
jgi:chromosome segregation ATPase